MEFFAGANAAINAQLIYHEDNYVNNAITKIWLAYAIRFQTVVPVLIESIRAESEEECQQEAHKFLNDEGHCPAIPQLHDEVFQNLFKDCCTEHRPFMEGPFM